ncbi:MAG TPA: hypothetical protein VGA50_17630 [Kiloniellales bacterium]|jgi:hypothetical protein
MPPVGPAGFDGRAAMPFETLSRNLAEIGTVEDFLKGLFPEAGGAEADRALEELREIAGTFARLWLSADGKAAFEHLCDVTLRRPAFVVSWEIDPMRTAMMGAQREGMNLVMAHIMRLVAIGLDQAPPEREGEKL